MKRTYTTTDQIPPGKYVRTWGGYDAVVDVFNQGTRLMERNAMGMTCEVRDNPGAVYVSADAVEVAA